MTTFSFGFNTQATTAATGLGGFSFGATTTTTATPTAGAFGGFSSAFNTQAQPATTTAASSFGSGFFSAPKKQVTFTGLGTSTATPFQSTATPFQLTSTPFQSTQTSTLFQATTTLSSTTTPLFQPSSSIGLGGFDLKKGEASGLAANEVTRIGECKSVKDQVVLSEILSTVHDFSTCMKAQRGLQEDTARQTCRHMLSVQKKLTTITQQINELVTILQRNTTHIGNFKKSAIQDLKDSEVAQRTKDTPIGLQPENVQPIEYLQRLVDSYEVQMATYRQQLLESEQFYSSLHRSPTPDGLSSVLEKVNESFVVMAANLHGVHETVKRQKESYLRYKQTHHFDQTDIFKAPLNQTPKHAPLTTIGPTPFSHLSNMDSVAITSVVNQQNGVGR